MTGPGSTHSGQTRATCDTGDTVPAAHDVHTEHRSSGIPTSFPLQTNALNVDGAPQSSRRDLRNWDRRRRDGFPAHVRNINNAARNLLEIIANAARADTGGDYPIRIYTIGMGELVRCPLGTRPRSPRTFSSASRTT